MKKKVITIIIVIVLIFVALGTFYTSRICYNMVMNNISSKIDSLELPEGSEVFYETKAEASDIIYLHIRAEKVIKCEEGSEYAIDYIKSHNSLSSNITVTEYGGMSDMEIYAVDNISDEDLSTIRADGFDKYIHIIYEKKVPYIPLSWFYYND